MEPSYTGHASDHTSWHEPKLEVQTVGADATAATRANSRANAMTGYRAASLNLSNVSMRAKSLTLTINLEAHTVDVRRRRLRVEPQQARRSCRRVLASGPGARA